MGPCDTCRKEWFPEHPSGGLSLTLELQALPRSTLGEGSPWGRTPRSGSTDRSSSPGLVFLCQRPRFRQPWEDLMGSGNTVNCGVCTCGLWGSHGSLLSVAHDLGWMVVGEGVRR